MPTLNWIGKDKVVTHHQDVPYRVLDKQYTFGEPAKPVEISAIAWYITIVKWMEHIQNQNSLI